MRVETRQRGTISNGTVTIPGTHHGPSPHWDSASFGFTIDGDTGSRTFGKEWTFTEEAS